MIERVKVLKKPPAFIGQRCYDCGRIFTPPTTPKARKPVVIVNVYTNKNQWRETRVFHGTCYDRRKESE